MASSPVTPIMSYFPLVVVFCQKYVKKTGIGTLVSIMLPYSVVFIICRTLFLIAYWLIGIPLGLQAGYVYPRFQRFFGYKFISLVKPISSHVFSHEEKWYVTT